MFKCYFHIVPMCMSLCYYCGREQTYVSLHVNFGVFLV